MTQVQTPTRPAPRAGISARVWIGSAARVEHYACTILEVCGGGAVRVQLAGGGIVRVNPAQIY
jgi:hypothetical protein